MPAGNLWLILAATSCGLAALAHVGCMVFGASWYRFFGAGEQMARLAEQGSWQPTLITAGITAVLLVWGAYALAGAGVIMQLPWTRPILLLISLVFLLRGSAFVLLMGKFPDNSLTFWLVSSAICLLIGGLFSVGLYQRWQALA